MITNTLAAIALVGALAIPVALAQKPSVYPAKGQSAQQKQKDDRECYAWAKQDTGIDPAVASAPAPQQTGPAVGGGERVRGAARGAVGGAAIGAIAGDAGTGAALVQWPVRWQGAQGHDAIKRRKTSKRSSSNSNR